MFFYDGNVKCYTGRHLAMTVVAGVVLFLAMVPPVYVVFVESRWLRVGPAISDGLAQGLR